MATALEQKCRDLVSELDLARPDDVTAVRPLIGGVASDIAEVDLGHRRICIKFALPKLKVAADWRAPVHRNAAEYAWLAVASELLPESAVKLFGRSEAQHGFAMEFLEGDDVYLWKANLLAEAPDRQDAEKVADMLGRIHAASAQPGFDTSPFQNRDDFRALRIEPYLTYTAQAYPDLGEPIGMLETLLYESRQVLVHGDASPKNIFFRDGRPIILDAECATMGDASFDPSFCINHLVLKAVHLPNSRSRLLADVARFWEAYATHASWEPPAEIERRICSLLPILMLARVDGKSPVEYLTKPEQAAVRRAAIPLIKHPVETLDTLIERVSANLKGGTP